MTPYKRGLGMKDSVHPSQDMLCGLQLCTSNRSVHMNHQGPVPDSGDLGGGGGARNSAFLASSQEIPMLLVW